LHAPDHVFCTLYPVSLDFVMYSTIYIVNVELNPGELNNINWENLLCDGNIESSVDNITDTLIKAAEKRIPNNTVTIRSLDPPWLHNEIRLAMRKRKRVHRKAKPMNTRDF